jgi:hypothetical protein
MANRRQHYIPQFYLRQFLNPGWVYRRGADAPHFAESPADVAVQKDYYGRNKATQKPLDDLNSYIEDNGAPSFKKLIRSPKTCTQYDWFVLSYLFANLFVRNPAVIEEWRATALKAAARVNAMAEKMIETLVAASLAGSDLSEFRSEPEDESATMTLGQFNKHAAKLRAEGGHRVAAPDLFSALVDIAKCIRQMSVVVVEAPPPLFFVTSDTPLTLQSRKTGSQVYGGWKNNDALGLIPLCPSRLLLMFYSEPSVIAIQQATPEQVAGLNLETMRFADQEVYSTFEYPEANDWMKAVGRWHPKE